MNTLTWAIGDLVTVSDPESPFFGWQGQVKVIAGRAGERAEVRFPELPRTLTFSNRQLTEVSKRSNTGIQLDYRLRGIR